MNGNEIKSKRNSMKQLKFDKSKATKRLNIIIIVGVTFLVIYGLITRNEKLKNSAVTVCTIVGFGQASGGSGLRPEVVKYEYHVNGVLYNDDSSFPDDNSVKVGNCYNLKYSIDDPRVTEILFKDGIVDCRK
jgi:hypothetical protein